jgi:hypothetical protein
MISPWLIYIAAARFLNRKDNAIYEDASHQCATTKVMMWIAGREDDEATMMHGSVSGSSVHRSRPGKRKEGKDQYIQELQEEASHPAYDDRW